MVDLVERLRMASNGILNARHAVDRIIAALNIPFRPKDFQPLYDEWEIITEAATLIETQAARIAELEGWQDISTAPRDGTAILCWNAFFGSYNSCWTRGEFPCGFSDGISSTWYPRPTHWRPLPTPPAHPRS